MLGFARKKRLEQFTFKFFQRFLTFYIISQFGILNKSHASTLTPSLPPNLNRAPGQILILSASPRTGGANYTYVWKKDGANLAPNRLNTEPVFFRGPLTSADAGLYSMIVEQGGAPVATNQTRVRISEKAPQGPGEDDFSRASGRWSGIYGFNTHDSYLSLTNGRLNYVVEARGAENTQAFYVWDSKARSDQDWEVMVEANISAAVPVGTSGQYFALRLSASSVTNPIIPFDGSEGLEISFAISSGRGRHIQNTECTLVSPGWKTLPDQSLPAATTNVVLRISYDKNSKILTSYYDADGAANGYQWQPGERLSMAGAVGLSNHFDLVISGIAENAHPAVANGQAFFDNFNYVLSDRRQFAGATVGWSILLGDGPGVTFSTYDGIDTWPQGFPTDFSGELKPVSPGSGTYRTDYAIGFGSTWDSFGDISVTLPTVDSNGDSLPDFLEPSLATSLTNSCAVSNNQDTISNAKLVMTKASGATTGSWTLTFTSASSGFDSVSGTYGFLGGTSLVFFDPITQVFSYPASLSYDGTEETWASGSYAVAGNGEIQVANHWEKSVMKTAPFETNQIGNLAFSLQRLNSSQLKGSGKNTNRPWTPGYNSFEDYFVKLSGVDFSVFTPRITSSDYVRGQVGQSLSFQVTALNSPNSFTANGLPPGLSIGSVSGLISGAPTTPGVYPVVLSAANIHGTGATQTNYFTVMGATRSLPLDDNFSTNSLSTYLNFTLNPAASLSHGSGRLNYVATSAGTNVDSIAGIVPNLTLSLTRSWRLEADVRVPTNLATPYTGAGLSLLREVDGGGIFQLYPDRINLKLARDATNYFGMHSFFDEVDFNDLTADVPAVSEARVRFLYDSSTRTLTGSCRPSGSLTWTDLGTESLNPAVFGSLGQAWELTDSSVLRVALWADSHTTIASGSVWVDNLSLTEVTEVQTMPSISQQPSSQTVAALTPVTLSVSALGGGLAYQWQRDGTNLLGANASSYVFSPFVAMAGNYRVIVSNTIGSVTSSVASLTVNKATPPTTWNPLAAITYPTPLSGAQLNASSAVAGSWSYSKASGTVLDAGTFSLTATFTPNDSSNYENVTRTNNLTVNKATQTIGGFNLSSGTVGTTLNPGATATAGAVAYTSSDSTVAQVNGSQILLLKSGYATITASHPGNANYQPVSAARNLTVKAPFVRFEFDPNTLLLGGVGATAGDKDDPGAKLVIGNPNNYYQATVVTNGGVVTTNYTAINTVATYSNLILGQPTGLNAYTNWVAGLGAGEGLARFNIFLRGDMANAAAWGQTLKLGPTNSPELLATGDAANGWSYQITQFGTNVPGNTNWGYYIEWFTTNDALRIRPGGADLGTFSFTAPLEQYLDGQVSQILFGDDGWSTAGQTVWFGTQNHAATGTGIPLYALEFDNLWGTASGGGVTPFAFTTNSLWNGTLVLQAQDANVRKIWYVTPDGAGRRDGMGWANAFDNLQAAIDRAASGDEIWVKKGAYKPSRYIDPFVTNDPRSRSFVLKGGLSLYGGFSGNETTLGQRDLSSTNFTTLTGDFSGNDSDTWPPASSRNENAYHVFSAIRQSGEIRLDGFVITAGNANNSSYVQPNNGSGIPYQSNDGSAVKPHEAAGAGLVILSSLRLENSTITMNHARNTGGVLAWAGSGSGVSASPQTLQIRNCYFEQNLASEPSSFGLGGALSIFENIDANILDTVFYQNRAPSGGAIALSSSKDLPYPAKARIAFCLFEENEAFVRPDSDGDGYLDSGNGGAILMEENCEAKIGNVVFLKNRVDPMGLLGAKANDPSFGLQSGHGGALAVTSGAQAKIVNSLFIQNRAEWAGGAIHVDKWSSALLPGQVEAYFSTFFGNVSRWGGGISNYKSLLSGFGNIFYQNTNQAAQISDVSNGTSLDGVQATSSFSYCVTTAGPIWQNTGVGNKDGNPGFYNSSSLAGTDGIWGTEDDGLRLVTNPSAPAVGLVLLAPPADFVDLDEDGDFSEPLPVEVLQNVSFASQAPFQAGCYQLTRDASPGMSPGVWDFGSGNYSLRTGEGLLLELGGTEASLYDRIFARAGSVTLDGIVNLMFWGTYSGPVAGSWDTFDLVWARDGIVLGNNLQVHFLQAGYQLETKVVGKDGGQLWQARIRQALVATPVEAAVQANPRLTVSHSPGPGGESEIFYTYRRPSGGGSLGGIYQAAGVRYLVEVSSDLRHWSPAPTSEITTLPEVEGWEAATVLVRGPAHKGFVRLRTEPAN
jgi:hypothetical protein